MKRRFSIQATDEARIRHILDAAEEVERFIAGRSRDDFQRDNQLFWAVAKMIENAGEAAVKLSSEGRDELLIFRGPSSSPPAIG